MSKTVMVRVDKEFVTALKNYKEVIKQKHNLEITMPQVTKLISKQLKPENIIKKKEKQKYYLDYDPEMRF